MTSKPFSQKPIPSTWPNDPVLSSQLANYLGPLHGEFDNERVIGRMNLSLSNSYSGTDFKITAFIPVDADPQVRQNYESYIRKKMDEASSDGNPRAFAYYQGQLERLAMGNIPTHDDLGKVGHSDPENSPMYIEDLFEVTDLSISSRRSTPEGRALGSTAPTGHGRGVRTIAGSMVVVLLKRDPLVELYSPDIGDPTDMSPYFVDRIPPFHMVLTATNEYGHSISSGIFHITLSDFGTVISVNDMYTEMQYTYKAMYMTPFVHEDVKSRLSNLVDMVGGHIGFLASQLQPPVKRPPGRI